MLSILIFKVNIHTIYRLTFVVAEPEKANLNDAQKKYILISFCFLFFAGNCIHTFKRN